MSTYSVYTVFDLDFDEFRLGNPICMAETIEELQQNFKFINLIKVSSLINGIYTPSYLKIIDLFQNSKGNYFAVCERTKDKIRFDLTEDEYTQLMTLCKIGKGAILMRPDLLSQAIIVINNLDTQHAQRHNN